MISQWGRNAYFGTGPRIAYFTEVNDIFNDIKERYYFSDIRLTPCDGVEEIGIPACLRCQEKQQQQERCSSGSLTAKAGSPRSPFDLDIDSFSYGISPEFRECSVTDSSTNVTDDTIRSPESTISPLPHLRQDWLALAGQGSLFFGASTFPSIIEDNDILERIERQPCMAPKPEEPKRSYILDRISGRIIIENPQKKQKLSPEAPRDPCPAEAEGSFKPPT